MRMANCDPKLKHHAKGLCQSCYKTAYRAAHQSEAAAYDTSYYATHRKEKLDYNATRLEEKRAYDKAYYATHRDEKTAYWRAHYIDHREGRAIYSKVFNATHLTDNAARQAKRIETDINYKLAAYLRGRMYHAIKNNQRVGSAVRDLGCSISKFRLFIEN